MALVKAVHRAMNRIAPFALAEPWDNVGLLLEAPHPSSSRPHVLLTIDLTPAVAASVLPPSSPSPSSASSPLQKVGVIVAYHPAIFSGLKSFTLSDPIQKSLLQLAAVGVSVVSPHTAIDVLRGGVNDWLIEGLVGKGGLRRGTPVQVKVVKGLERPEAQGEGEEGIGRVVQLEEGETGTVDEIVQKVKRHLGLEHVMLARSLSGVEVVKSVAVCAGSGGSVLKGVKADLYLTGEMSHHEVLAAVGRGSHVILCRHTNTERGYLSAYLKDKLQAALDADRELLEGGGDQSQRLAEMTKVLVSEVDKDPLEVV